MEQKQAKNDQQATNAALAALAATGNTFALGQLWEEMCIRDRSSAASYSGVPTFHRKFCNSPSVSGRRDPCAEPACSFSFHLNCA